MHKKPNIKPIKVSGKRNTSKRYAKYVANEREAERSPRVKRNGKILNRFSDSDVSK